MRHRHAPRTAHDRKGSSLLENLRVCLEAVIAVALMAIMGIISAFVAAGVTGDSAMSLPVVLSAFILTGAFLVYRHWRALRRSTPAARLSARKLRRSLMRQSAFNNHFEPDSAARRVMVENIAAGLWLALLIGFGCFVLNAFAESARREECLMRGAAVCSRIVSLAVVGWEQADQGTRKRAGLAEHLKYSRWW